MNAYGLEPPTATQLTWKPFLSTHSTGSVVSRGHRRLTRSHGNSNSSEHRGPGSLAARAHQASSDPAALNSGRDGTSPLGLGAASGPAPAGGSFAVSQTLRGQDVPASTRPALLVSGLTPCPLAQAASDGEAGVPWPQFLPLAFAEWRDRHLHGGRNTSASTAGVTGHAYFPFLPSPV